MRALQVSWGIIWRMVAWGLGTGIMLGGIYGAVVAFIVGLLYGAIVGGIAGLLLGLVDGIVMALITSLAFSPITNSNVYRITMGISCVLTPIFSIALLSISGWGFVNPFRSIWTQGIYWEGLIPEVIAISASVLASVK